MRPTLAAIEHADRDAIVRVLAGAMNAASWLLPGRAGDLVWNALVALQDWRYLSVMRGHVTRSGGLS